MASGERRLGTGRRGMTVLGKIPTPSVPKPINLPSQRLENRGLEPNVELVPRGTFSWGSAGRSNAAGANKAGASGISSSPPTNSGAWNGAIKMQGLSASGNDAGSLVETNQPSSAGNGTRPSSAPSTATNRVWGSSAKTQVEVPVQSIGFTLNPIEPVTLGSKEIADLIPQQNNVLSNRPTSADGTVVDRDTRPYPGINAHASAGSGPGPGPGPEGFQHRGDGYNDHRPFVWQGIPPAGRHELHVRAGPYSGPLPRDVYYSPFGVPHHGNMKDRDMVAVRMVNSPGVYGSYPSHPRPPEGFSRPGYGSYRPQTGHAEQFAMLGNIVVGASSCAPGMSMGFFPDGNNFLLKEGEGMFESGQDFRKYRDGQFGTVPRDGGYAGLQRDAEIGRNISSVSTYGIDRNHRMPRAFGRHNHASKEGGISVKEGVASVTMPVPEKKITILTKMPRGEAPSTENIINNSTLPPDSNQGNEGCQEKTELSKNDTENESHENVSTILEVKGAKKADEFIEIKKVDGGEVKRSTREITFLQTWSEIKQDGLHSVAVNCSKDNLLEIKVAVSEACPSPPSPKTWRKAACKSDLNASSSTKKLLASTTDEKITDLESQVQEDHHLKSDADSHGRKISKQARKSAFSSGSLESAGGDFQAVCIEPTRPTVAEDISRRDDQKAKTRALNHKSEKEWRPKSPVVESKLAANAPGAQAVKGGKRSQQAGNTDTVREKSCSTGSVVLEASSLSQTQKIEMRRVYRNIESLSSSASSGIISSKEAPFLLTEDSSSGQSRVVEVADSQPTQCENDRNSVIDASSSGVCNTARSAVKVFNNADASKIMATEGFSFKSDHKAKSRQFNQKGEKEWRPKSPAVDSTAASDNISGSHASEANVSSTSVSEIDISSNHDLITEQEGLQPFDTYDYEGQRAKLKEIASQRAKQRRKEEEERTREQKAKALAKLEELNRRTSASPRSEEVMEHGSMVFLDEVPNKKTERKLNSSRRSSMDVPLHDSCALEQQQVDEDMVWAPVQNSTPVSATTGLKNESIPKAGEGSKELQSNEIILSQSSRNKKNDESDRNISKTAEKHQIHKPLTATSNYQEQIQLSRREIPIHQEDLPSVHDTEVESSSSKTFGVEMKKGEAARLGRVHGARRQTASTQNQIGRVASALRNERKGILHAVEEHRGRKQSNLSPVVSQSDNMNDKGGVTGKVASRPTQISSVEGPKKIKAEELSVLEEHFDSPERNNGRSFINAVAGHPQQSAGNSLMGQKHRSKMERSFTIEQVQGFEIKQPMEPMVSSDASFGSENVGRSHASWRQKNLNGNYLPNSDKPISGVNKDIRNALEESLDTPIQSHKPHKVKNGGKQSSQDLGCWHQQGQIQVEARELCVVEERTTEQTGFNANSDPKREVEAKASESVKVGRSNNLWRQKNSINGSSVSKQASMKDLNEGHAESLAATEACEEIVDPTHLYAVSTSQSSNPHNLRANTRNSHRAAFGAPPLHKNRPVKLSNAIPSEKQAGSQVSLGEHTLGQAVSVSRHPVRSSATNTQGLENEQLQETETSSLGHQRKRGSQLETEPIVPLETNAENHKNQQVYSTKVAETISDQRVPPSSGGKSRFNQTHTENRKMNRHHQAVSQAFRPREQHHEAQTERGNNRGQHRLSRGRDKPSRQSQLNGCSTTAEFDRRGAEPAIKTEISY